MASPKYVLVSEDASDSFNFSIRDKVYDFRYPTTAEMRDIVSKFNELDKETDDAKKQELARALDTQLQSFISPVDHDTPINDALDAETVVTVRHFNKMIRDEVFSMQ